jgi:hypothetical protein
LCTYGPSPPDAGQPDEQGLQPLFVLVCDIAAFWILEHVDLPLGIFLLGEQVALGGSSAAFCASPKRTRVRLRSRPRRCRRLPADRFALAGVLEHRMLGRQALCDGSIVGLFARRTETPSSALTDRSCPRRPPIRSASTK